MSGSLVSKQANETLSLPTADISFLLKRLIANEKRRRKCSIIIKIMKLIAAILVPLAIGAFTVVQTLQEINNDQLQRDAEYQNRIDEQLKMKFEEQRDDAYVIELRIQNIYEKFLTELQPILRLSNENLSEADLIFVRAKTFAAFEQIDSKRKSYLIKFLYESQLLYTYEYMAKVNYHFVDLDGADLSNCQFGSNDKSDVLKAMYMQGIRLSGVRLRDASFNHVDLTNSTFEDSDLTGTNFTNTILLHVNFQYAIVDHSNFVNSLLNSGAMNETSFRNSIFHECDISTTGQFWRNCDFSNTIFQNIYFTSFQIKKSIFDQTKFVNITMVGPFTMSNVRMQNSLIDNFQLISTRYQIIFNNYSDLSGTIFRYVKFRHILFDNINMEKCQFFNVTIQQTARFNRVNILGVDFQQIDGLDGIDIIDSILPNGSFKTSFPFGENLLENGNAEEECRFRSRNKSIYHWESEHVVQLFYNLTKIKSDNNENDCLFSGGQRHRFYPENVMFQIINVSYLTQLFYLNQTKFFVSALLGGIESIADEVSIEIHFKNRLSRIIHTATINPVSNHERHNKSLMILKTMNGTIPYGTTEIYFYVIFKQKYYNENSSIQAMTDNLKFIIQK